MRLEQLLSEAELQIVVERFYESVYRDPVLGPLFVGVSREAQIQRLVGFIQMTAASGNDALDGRFLRDAHARLHLTDALFERRRTLLNEAIRACGHGDDVVSAWETYDLRWRKWVLTAPASL